MAKKRQWEVRKSLKRMSRRLTGRKDVEEEERLAVRQSRRRGVVTIGSKEHLTGDVEKGKGVKMTGKSTEIEMKEGKKKRNGA